MKRIAAALIILSAAGCADENIYPVYTPDSLKMHAQAAINRDFQAGDMSDLTISNIKENPPSVTGKRNIDFTVSSAATNRVYHCIRSDYSVRRFGTRDLNPESPGHMVCELQKKS
ncbi:hypothetical protein PQM29_003416 [Morganella morganii]|nr:hypothetical protein [Morganella morganii]